MELNKTVEEFISGHPEWKRELALLREIMNRTEMEETIKWGIPVYTIKGKNVLGIGAFKAYAGIWFYQGVFLKDDNSLLLNAQEGKTKAMRQWRFASFEEMDTVLIEQYVAEAISNQKAGKEIKPEKKPLIIPDHLAEELSRNISLSEAFDTLSLTLKREYAEYIMEAKRETTKLTRMEKITPMILQQIGLNDKYR
jgi:uncharacterized protein YdeI (YjbR/CyaY-like superfamily)